MNCNTYGIVVLTDIATNYSQGCTAHRRECKRISITMSISKLMNPCYNIHVALSWLCTAFLITMYPGITMLRIPLATWLKKMVL